MNTNAVNYVIILIYFKRIYVYIIRIISAIDLLRGVFMQQMKRDLRELPARLASCKTEEEVKSEFSKSFRISINTSRHIDLYTEDILFEFKYARFFL